MKLIWIILAFRFPVSEACYDCACILKWPSISVHDRLKMQIFLFILGVENYGILPQNVGLVAKDCWDLTFLGATLTAARTIILLQIVRALLLYS